MIDLHSDIFVTILTTALFVRLRTLVYVSLYFYRGFANKRLK